jgi:hypothetical protein
LLIFYKEKQCLFRAWMNASLPSFTCYESLIFSKIG